MVFIKGVTFGFFLILVPVRLSLKQNENKKDIIICPSVLTEDAKLSFVLFSTFSETKNRKRSFLWIFISGAKCHWLKLLLLLCMDVETNPGPMTRSGTGEAAEAEQPSTATATAPKESSAELKNCLFYGNQKCSNQRWPYQTELLRDMTELVDDDDNLKLPANFTERDLLLNRLKYECPETLVFYGTQLCSEDRDRLGSRFVKRQKTKQKGSYGYCKWKSHHTAADSLLTYPMSWQIMDPQGAKRPIGTPMCRHCYSKAKESVNDDIGRSLIAKISVFFAFFFKRL